MPFSALQPSSISSSADSDKISIRLLTSARDLLRFRRSKPDSTPPLVVANPSFDRQTQSNAAVISPPNRRGPQETDGSARKVWSQLPGSEDEGQRVSKLLSGKLLTGPNASVQRLLEANNPIVLHIASHGFFLPDITEPFRPPVENGGMRKRMYGYSDPLLRSGLVLAGANHASANQDDDGYLTAAEAVALRLDGTALVTLSACSTGQGQIKTGVGVLGLQRSLFVAGAQSSLLSLWKVDDSATAEFMVRFYKKLKAGSSRGDALAETQEEFRNGEAGRQWRDFYYWGPWQLVGDWRPIPGL